MLGDKLKQTLVDLMKSKASKRKSSVKSATCDNSSFKEPSTELGVTYDNDTSVDIFRDRDNTDSIYKESNMSKGKGSSVTQFPSGSFFEDHTNGDHVDHVSKDSYLIVEGDSMTLCVNEKKQVTGSSSTQVGGSVNYKFGGTLKIHTAGTTITVSGGSVKIEASSVEINAASTKLTQVVDAATRGFSSLPLCVFTGAPHTCNTAP